MRSKRGTDSAVGKKSNLKRNFLPDSAVQVRSRDYQPRHSSLGKQSFSGRAPTRHVSEQAVKVMLTVASPPETS